MVTVDDSSAAPMTATPCRCPLCFYNAMHMHSADYAVARPLSVVHRYCVETAKYSHTILVFAYKTSWHQFGNLTDSSFNLEKTRSRLISTSKSWLSSWFVNNYIRRCAQFCPHNVSQLFHDVDATTELRNSDC